MSSGRRYTLKSWWNKVLAVSITVGKPFMGINLHDLKNLSMITSIVVSPLELGRLMMKSINRWDHAL